MAHASVPAAGFKPEIIKFVMDIIQKDWPERSQEKLAAVFAFLMSKGVKSEADVETINEDELGAVIGSGAARRILQQFKELGKAGEHGKGNKNPCSESSPQGARDDSSEVPHCQSESAADSGTLPQQTRGSQNDMTEMIKMFMQLLTIESDKNREMVRDLQKGMKDTLERLTGTILSSMEAMTEKLTLQIELQQMDLQKGMKDTIERVTGIIRSSLEAINEKLTLQMKLQEEVMFRLREQIMIIERTRLDTARETQERMARTQQMNHTMLMEVMRKLNVTLEARRIP